MTEPIPPRVRVAVRELVANMIESAHLSDAKLPHLIVLTDPATGTRTGYGPLPDAWQATEAALELVTYHRAQAGPPDMAWEIVAWFELDDGRRT